MTEPKEKEAPKEPEEKKETDSEEGKRYTGGPIPKISLPKKSND